MESYKVIKTSKFNNSLKDIAIYIAEESGSTTIAYDFTSRLLHFAEYTFSIAPRMGEEIAVNERIIRKVPFTENGNYSYVIEISENSKTVFLVDVFHSRRDLNKIISKL